MLRSGELQSTDDTDHEKKRIERLKQWLVGNTLIVDARVAGLNNGLLDKDEDALVHTIDDGSTWIESSDEEPAAQSPLVRFRIRTAHPDAVLTSDRHWRERARFATELSADGEVQRWLIVDKWKHDASTEEDRSAGRLQRLDEHQQWAADIAHALARRLGLPDEYAGALATAARLHDEGKRSPRWQLAFRAPSDTHYAKTKGPINYRLLDGYRHEVGSLPIAASDAAVQSLPENLQDLVLHLIAAHHGFARPIISTRACEDAPPSALEARALEVALRFARLQKQWGPWGLAWWEALLRAADQQASRDNDVADEVIAKEIG
jgi:CRISPR-associated endonuclease/helicase Cas3